MFIKGWCMRLAALFVLLVSAGCITSDVVVNLNPDGSGTVEYTSHFDRAPEEVREQIRKQMSDSRSTTTLEHSLDNLREYYPEPHFKLLVHEEDREQLKSRIVLRFADVNALLSERKTAHLGLKSLDFSVAGDRLVFSVKEDRLSQPWPKKYDEYPALERIAVVNAASGEQVVFERSINSKSAPADWSASLAFPGHKMARRQVKVFHDYPIVELPECRVERAAWVLRHHRQWSALNLGLLAEFPSGGAVYTRWENPVVMAGAFLPEGALRCVVPNSLSGKGELKGGGAQALALSFAVPTNRVSAFASAVVRIKAYRSAGSKVVEVGALAPNTEYALDGLTLKTDGLKNNRVGFRLPGGAPRLKNALLQTRRGNRFKLKWSSRSGDSFGYWELLPLEGCTLLLELYNESEPCYVDLRIPELDLAQRSWRRDESAGAADSGEWKKALAAEHPVLFEVAVPEVGAGLFEDKALYAAYFEGLEDRQLIPAIVQVVDYMLQHNPKKGQYWIQEIARTEIGTRKAFLDSARKAMAAQLFALYRHTPERMLCLSTFFSCLGLTEEVQAPAVEQLRRGSLRFADDDFFSRELSEEEADVLKRSIVSAENWMQRKEVLEILNRAGCADAEWVMRMVNERAYSEHFRAAALRIAFEKSYADHRVAGRLAADSSEPDSMRTTALGMLIKQDAFPAAALRACLSDLSCSGRALGMLDRYLARGLKGGEAERAAMKTNLQPFIPLLQDLSEQLSTYEADKALPVLEKIGQL